MGEVFGLWRVFNLILLLGAFLGPWIPSCADSISQYEPYTGIQVVERTAVSVTKISLEHILLDVMDIAFLVAVACTLAYSAANVSAVFVKAGTWRRGRIGLLAGAMLGNGIAALVFSHTYMPFTRLMWGYWTMWAGLISSGALEAMDWQVDREQSGHGASRGGQMALAHYRTRETNSVVDERAKSKRENPPG